VLGASVTAVEQLAGILPQALEGFRTGANACANEPVVPLMFIAVWKPALQP